MGEGKGGGVVERGEGRIGFEFWEVDEILLEFSGPSERFFPRRSRRELSVSCAGFGGFGARRSLTERRFDRLEVG